MIWGDPYFRKHPYVLIKQDLSRQHALLILETSWLFPHEHAHWHTHTHTLWQKLRHQVPKSWKKMFHFISYAATPINKTEGQQFKPKLVTKQSPSTEPKVNSFNKSSYVYTGSIQCLRWPLTVYFPSGPLRAKMGCGRSDRSSKASIYRFYFFWEGTHTHTPSQEGWVFKATF